MYDFFHDTIIPELIKEGKEETGEEMTKESILRQYGLTKVCLITSTTVLGMTSYDLMV